MVSDHADASPSSGLRRYRVEVSQEGDAWLASVLDAPGAHTYSRDRRDLPQEIREAIRAMEGLPDDVVVELVYQPSGEEYTVGPDATISDIDLDKEEWILPDGRRLTEELAEQIGEEVSRRHQERTLQRTYPIRVSRDGRFWLIDIPGIGMTQARRPGEIDEMAIDYIAGVLDVPESSVVLARDDEWMTAFPPARSYSIREASWRVVRNRLAVTSWLFATAMGLSYLLGRKRS